MDKEITFKGEWFLPNNVDNKVKGILVFKPSEKYSRLELFGSLLEYQDIYNIDLILGNSFDSGEITLYKCYVKNLIGISRNAENDFKGKKNNYCKSSIYEVEYIFDGAHITTIEDLVFQKISTEIFNLAEWLGIHGFSNFNHNFQNEEGVIINCNYLEPKAIDFKINNKLNGTINFSSSTSSISRFQKEARISQITYLTLISSEYLDLFEVLDYIYKFQNFLVISLFEHTNPTNIELRCDKFSHNVTDGRGENIQQPKQINLYYSQRKKITRDAPKTHFEMLFSYEDIKLQFPLIISKWFEKYELLKPTFNLIFYQFYLSEQIIDVLFLNLAQAVESFHYLLNINNNKRISSAEFARRKKVLKEAINNEELYSWVSNQLHNGLSLDTRLKALINDYAIPPKVLEFIGDTETFVKQVKVSRNYYTHFNPKEKDNALKGSELVGLYQKLQLLLISVILIEVGFEERLLNRFFIHKSSRVFHI